jgi:hypothetical protein
MKTLWHTLLVLTCALALAACGGGEEASNGDGGASNGGGGDAAAVNYDFTVSVGDAETFTPENAEAQVPLAPGVSREDYSPAFEIDTNLGNGLFRVELGPDPLAVGEREVQRALVTFATEIDGERVEVGCGSNDGTPDDATMTITEVTNEGLSGSITITLTSCDDFYTAEAVDLESITVTGEFTNVPYLPEE